MQFEDEIRDLKKEIVETHNLIIKSDNLVKNLSADIRQFQKQQERYERKYIFNSVVAYVIFVIIIFGGLYVAFEAKVGVVRRENEVLEEKLRQAEAEREESQKKLSVRIKQESVTERFLRLKRQNQDHEALKEADRLDAKVLSPLLSELVGKESAELRGRLAQKALEEGESLLQKGHLARALREFDRAVKIKPPGPMLARVYFQHGQTLLKLNKNARAAESFLEAANADSESPGADNALFLAATALETSGDIPRALTIYERLLRDHPNSRHLAQVRLRVSKLTRSEVKTGPAPKPPPPRPESPPPEPEGSVTPTE